ncbi:hypothetical protein [Crocinitomix algicola]|uniref:hypothetical protein n=1 Tax=Crocinitomix algicola TaxID=1740263 RepID=UPI00083470A4|nr:hypothetical protein [Crocinitomix algicola]
MEEALDTNFKSIKTPHEAGDYYLPLLVKKKMDLMEIKNELREKHYFTEEDVRITARWLSNKQMSAHALKGDKNNAIVGLIIGLVFMIGGLALYFYLLRLGFIAVISFLLTGIGLLRFISALKTLMSD